MRFALDAQKSFDDRALLEWKSEAGLERRLFEKTIGDLPRGAAAGRGDARDREKILDEGARALLIGAFEDARTPE